MLKKTLVLLGIFLLLVTGVAFAEENITVLVNGDPVVFDVPPQKLPVYDEAGEYVGDRVMIPLRAVSEALNCDVYWNGATEGITIYRQGSLSIMWINKDCAFSMVSYAVSDAYIMDVPPTMVEDRTLVPVRAVAELLGASVNWIDEINTVTVTDPITEWEENAGMAEQYAYYELFLYQEYDKASAHYQGTLETITGKFVLADGKEISFELYPEIAPATVERFVTCAKDGFYNDTIFHRVIEGFVAQGGGFVVEEETITPKEISYENLPGEFLANGFFNFMAHKRGVLSFARTEDLNGGGTQFFIAHQDVLPLDGYYAVFGNITEGMDIVDEICASETDENDTPVEPIIVKEVIINEN